jgi:hypothetical protein
MNLFPNPNRLNPVQAAAMAIGFKALAKALGEPKPKKRSTGKRQRKSTPAKPSRTRKARKRR